MRVLVLAPYISVQGHRWLGRNITGFGLMVRDICEAIAGDASVDVLTNALVPEVAQLSGVRILRCRRSDLVLHARVEYMLSALRALWSFKPGLSSVARLLRYYYACGHCHHVVRNGGYDIVHIHGVVFGTMPFLECCARLGQLHLVTMHGLNSFSDSVGVEAGEGRYERDFIRRAARTGLPVTVISTGMRRTLEAFLAVDGMEAKIKVIVNGTRCRTRSELTPGSRPVSGCDGKFLMLCVGNVSPRKNQLQLIRAYKLLPPSLQEGLRILFVGDDRAASRERASVLKAGLSARLEFCGGLSRDAVLELYGKADFTVLPSVSEGFGLSIIEGFVHGLPSIVFSDIDAVPDLYDERCMVLVHERTDEALAAGLVRIVTTRWDRDCIRRHGNRFSLRATAARYLEFYQQILEDARRG